MSVLVAEVNATALQVVPKDGRGAVTSPYGTDHLSSGAEVYTATSCTATWPAGGEPNAGTTAGDLVATQDGLWGVLVSGTATKANVDFWRDKSGARGIPTDGQDCRIYNGKCIEVGARQVYLHRIIFVAPVAGTFDVTDLFGNVLYRHTIPAAGAVAHTVEFCSGGDRGLLLDSPIGFKTIATMTATVVFGY